MSPKSIIPKASLCSSNKILFTFPSLRINNFVKLFKKGFAFFKYLLKWKWTKSCLLLFLICEILAISGFESCRSHSKLCLTFLYLKFCKAELIYPTSLPTPIILFFLNGILEMKFSSTYVKRHILYILQFFFTWFISPINLDRLQENAPFAICSNAAICILIKDGDSP